MTTKIYCIHLSGWNEGSLTRSSEIFDWDFMGSNQRIELEGDLFPFLMRLTQENDHVHGPCFIFLMSLTQVKEIC